MLLFLSFFLVAFAQEECNPKTIQATKVVLPSDPDYQTATTQYASKTINVVKIKPAVVVFCSTEKEVQNAIKFAQKCKLTISTRSGGHSYTGCSTCGDGCMQIDVGAMDWVDVNGLRISKDLKNAPETPPLTMDLKEITAGSGCKLGGVDKVISLFGLSLPHGGCKTVRLGGHFQSSAWGHLAGSYGSGIDRVTKFRIVLPNATAVTVSRNDKNNTLYWSILGSAPGSWGVITEYTLDGIHNSEVPHSRFLIKTYLYTSDLFYKIMTHSQSILIEQEKRDTRDFKVLLNIGPKTDSTDLKTQAISVYLLWTGIDSGYLSDDLYAEYIQPYDDLGPEPFPDSLDLPLPLSLIIDVAAVEFLTPGWHYHVQSFHSDHWWEDDFFKLIVKEVDRRIAIPDTFISFQFLPLGSNTQWWKNENMNALTWRHTRMYVDDWIMYRNESQAESVRKGMVDFRDATRKYWQMTDGSDRSTWMSPMTTYPGSTNLRDPKIRKSFFPDDKVFAKLQALKRELDPHGLFADQSTIPLN